MLVVELVEAVALAAAAAAAISWLRWVTTDFAIVKTTLRVSVRLRGTDCP